MAVKLRCPECRATFLMPGGHWPSMCPECGYDTSIPDDRDEVEIPAFLSGRVRSADETYRQIERGSEERVHLAAQAAGCDPSEMAGLRVTNLHDNPRPGDVAAIEDTAAAKRLGIQDSSQLFQRNEAAAVAADGAAGIVTHNGQVVGRNIEPRAGIRAHTAVTKGLFGR